MPNSQLTVWPNWGKKISTDGSKTRNKDVGHAGRHYIYVCTTERIENQIGHLPFGGVSRSPDLGCSTAVLVSLESIQSVGR